MTSPRAYLNGDFVPFSEMSIPVTDAGFVQGLTVAEQLRTFGGQVFRLPEHLARLERSLQIVGVDPGLTRDDLAAVAHRLIAHNHALLETGDDLGLSIFITPGPYPTFAPRGSRPTVGLHTYPIPFGAWSDKYEQGQHLIIADTRQVSPLNWPPELKCRSRMHYYLADCQARRVDPAARALLLDLDGFVSEASTANVLAVFSGEGIVSPPIEKILPGISMMVLAELAALAGIPFVRRDIRPHELASAAELLLCSTSPCLLPVVQLDQRPIGSGRVGPVYRQLLQLWSDHVGVDIAAQARRFAGR